MASHHACHVAAVEPLVAPRSMLTAHLTYVYTRASMQSAVIELHHYAARLKGGPKRAAAALKVRGQLQALRTHG